MGQTPGSRLGIRTETSKMDVHRSDVPSAHQVRTAGTGFGGRTRKDNNRGSSKKEVRQRGSNLVAKQNQTERQDHEQCNIRVDGSKRHSFQSFELFHEIDHSLAGINIVQFGTARSLACSGGESDPLGYQRFE